MTLRFSASVAGMVMSCPASANLDVAIPGYQPPEVEATKASVAGTRLHEVLEPLHELSLPDLRAVTQVLDYMLELRETRRFKVLVEQEVQAAWLNDTSKTTADVVLYVQDEIHIVDTKMGKIHVEVVENAQLLFYAASYAALAPKAKGVTVHILQPGAKNFASWYVTADRLAEFMDEARVADQKIKAKDTTFGPSDHCTFCPANPHGRGAKSTVFCPAMVQILYPPILNEDEILDL